MLLSFFPCQDAMQQFPVPPQPNQASARDGQQINQVLFVLVPGLGVWVQFKTFCLKLQPNKSIPTLVMQCAQGIQVAFMDLGFTKAEGVSSSRILSWDMCARPGHLWAWLEHACAWLGHVCHSCAWPSHACVWLCMARTRVYMAVHGWDMHVHDQNTRVHGRHGRDRC